MGQRVFGPNYDFPSTIETPEESNGVNFDDRFDSPFRVSLVGPYDLGEQEKLRGASTSGTCPFCNNNRRDELNRLIWDGILPKDLKKMLPFTRTELALHVAHHMAPMYQSVQEEKGLVDESLELVPKEDGDADERKVTAIVTRVVRFAEAAKGVLDSDDVVQCTGATFGEGDTSPGSHGYAFTDGVQTGPLIPWTVARAKEELTVMEHEAINMYDELLECRFKAREVYTAVMQEGDPKLYGTAIAAIREQRGVVETMGQMSLIAKSLADGNKDTMKRVSPEIASIMAQLGVPLDDSKELRQAAKEVLRPDLLEAPTEDEGQRGTE